jgi:uncharacterized membrane protein
LALADYTIRFSLAFWIGGTLLVILAAPVLFKMVPSRDLAGRIFGEILRRFEAVQQILSVAMVASIFLELEAAGTMPVGRRFAAGAAIFLAVATNVYLSMVLRPRINYTREKVGSFDAAPTDDVWRQRFASLHRRSAVVMTLGWVAAMAALALRTPG